MKLNQLSLIKSERGLRSAVSALFYGAKGGLLSAAANFDGVNRTVKSLEASGYPDRAESIRSGKRYEQLESTLKNVALRAASLSAFADSHGIILEIDLSPDVPRGKDEKQLAAAAEAAGISVEIVKTKEREAMKRRFDQQADAQMLAEGEFWSAGFDDDVEIKTETVLNALVRQRDYMLEWSNLDLGEMTILRHDIDTIEALLSDEDDKEERSTDGGIDNATIATPSMTQQNQEHQDEIAMAKGDKPRSKSKRSTAAV